MARWDDVVDRLFNPEGEVTIGVVGKYVGLQDAYKSLTEALVHGGIANRVKVNIHWLDAELFEHPEADIAAAARAAARHPRPRRLRRARQRGQDRLRPFRPRAQGALLRHLPRHADGLHRGGAEHRRHRRAPARTEFGEAEEPVVGLITEWMSEEGLQQRARPNGDLGGTMRLGAYEAVLAGNSVVRTHLRRRPDQRTPPPPLRGQHPLQGRAGGRAAWSSRGMSPDGELPEIVERPDHPWFVGVQFHPELKSKPFDPHPLFATFIEAAVKQSRLV